ncbi:pyruvate kinase [Vampirovibrio chlorellavorus]|uniref:pyruvate kinase n=1 Tax=Vampirovibrio chlorellavorus TaxID=758823 RepID=UPI0026EC7A37|nr:pyruvate kinase [Vampirovibrio chlorellavorus]
MTIATQQASPQPQKNNPALQHADISLLHRTKIVATLGPATASPEMVKQLALAGVSVFRLNMSHGNADEQGARVQMLRNVAAELNQPLAILADLQGPKLRTGFLKDNQPIPLEDFSVVEFTSRTRESSPGVVATKYGELIAVLEPGALILLDDGKIRLEVLEKVNAETLKCQVVQGGLLEARKGINIPGTTLPIPSLTEKDKEDVAAAVAAKVDYIALSFVQQAKDIVELRQYVESLGYTCPPVVAKIEKPQALKDIDNIIQETDALMVARGDLGVELRPEEVPVAQKMLVAKANAAAKPVIIATQMLESMISSVQPSRSDVSDIANAVFDGADALMLSGETSVGEHPVATVTMMGRIIHEAEKSIFANSLDRPMEENRTVSPNFYHAIAQTASYAARKANIKAVVVFSNSGSMAQRISKLKPTRPIIALTPKAEVANKMALLWGVVPVVIPQSEQTDVMLENGEKAIFEKNLLKKGEGVVFCAGNTQMKGADNMLKIYHIGHTE